MRSITFAATKARYRTHSSLPFLFLLFSISLHTSLIFSLPVFHLNFLVHSSQKPFSYSSFPVPYLIHIFVSLSPDFTRFLPLLVVHLHWVTVPRVSKDTTFLCTLACFNGFTFNSTPPPQFTCFSSSFLLISAYWSSVLFTAKQHLNPEMEDFTTNI